MTGVAVHFFKFDIIITHSLFAMITGIYNHDTPLHVILGVCYRTICLSLSMPHEWPIMIVFSSVIFFAQVFQWLSSSLTSCFSRHFWRISVFCCCGYNSKGNHHFYDTNEIMNIIHIWYNFLLHHKNGIKKKSPPKNIQSE